MKHKHTKTVVAYKRDGVKYSHVFPDVLGESQVQQRMLMQLHIPRQDIVGHWYK